MIHWDPTVSLGTLVGVITIVVTIAVAYTRAVGWFHERFALMEATAHSVEAMMLVHAKQLENHSQRMDRYEARYVDIARDLQRLVGRMEYDRRQGGE